MRCFRAGCRLEPDLVVGIDGRAVTACWGCLGRATRDGRWTVMFHDLPLSEEGVAAAQRDRSILPPVKEIEEEVSGTVLSPTGQGGSLKPETLPPPGEAGDAADRAATEGYAPSDAVTPSPEVIVPPSKTKLCIWPGCDRPPKAFGFCQTHRGRCVQLGYSSEVQPSAAEVAALPERWAERRTVVSVKLAENARATSLKSAVKRRNEAARPPEPLARFDGPDIKDDCDGLCDESLEICRILGIDTTQDYDLVGVVRKLAENAAKWKSASDQFCAAHVGVTQVECPVCSWTAANKDLAGELNRGRDLERQLVEARANQVEVLGNRELDALLNPLRKTLGMDGNAPSRILERAAEVIEAIAEGRTGRFPGGAAYIISAPPPSPVLTEDELDRRHAALVESRRLRAIALSEVSGG